MLRKGLLVSRSLVKNEKRINHQNPSVFVESAFYKMPKKTRRVQFPKATEKYTSVYFERSVSGQSLI